MSIKNKGLKTRCYPTFIFQSIDSYNKLISHNNFRYHVLSEYAWCLQFVWFWDQGSYYFFLQGTLSPKSQLLLFFYSLLRN